MSVFLAIPLAAFMRAVPSAAGNHFLYAVGGLIYMQWYCVKLAFTSLFILINQIGLF